VPPPTTTTPTILLPTAPPYEVSFAKTTQYYWPNFDVNATATSGSWVFGTPAGPFGFGSAVQLDDQHCLADNNFAGDSDTCILNPRNCPNGLSVSFFSKLEYWVDPDTLETNFTRNFTRHYLLSTGGDRGSPGIAIYREGPIMGALLSTGNETWEVKVMGNLPINNTWTNIALRWEPLKFSDQETYDQELEDNNGDVSKLGGLQLFLNLERVGQSLLPLELDCTCPADTMACTAAEATCASSGPGAEDAPGLSPPTMMLGCHTTRAKNGVFGDFSGGIFDEVAFWDKRIGDDEIYMFLGGYKASFDNVDASELVNMMNSVDFSDPDQAATALQVLSLVVGEGEVTTTPFSNIYPTTELPAAAENATTDKDGAEETTLSTTTTEASAKESEEAAGLRSLVGIMLRLTEQGNLPANLSTGDFLKRIAVSQLVGDFMDPLGRHAEGWAAINRDNDAAGAHAIRESLEGFATTALLARVLEPKESVVQAEVHSANSFLQYEKVAAPEVRRRQLVEGETFTFPLWRARSKRSPSSSYVLDPLEKWEHFPESVQVPLSLFSGACVDQDISFVGAIYENLPDPGRKNPVTIWSRNIQVDSRVVSISLAANQWDKESRSFGAACRPDPKLLVRKRLLVTLATKSPVRSRRQLLFHAGEERSAILRRHCAIWNPAIGLHGAWDTAGITTERVDETGAACATSKLGTYAIVAELVDPPFPYEEEEWLVVAKLVGYVLSMVLLVIFVGIVQFSAYLWEQFHILRMNLALAVLLGHTASLVAEVAAVQEDRHLCTLVGAAISYSYTAAAFLLASEAHACFKAITGGIVGGRAIVYLPTAWGLPAIALGYNVFANLVDMGDDPKCMVGWENMVKWHFLGPLLIGVAAAFILMAIVLCNLATPAIRKSSILEEVGSVCNGMVCMVIYSTLTWTFAPLAYIRFPDLALPDFYPAFQVLNSCQGILIFVLLGLLSTRFRAVLAGTVLHRKNMIMETTAKRKN